MYGPYEDLTYKSLGSADTEGRSMRQRGHDVRFNVAVLVLRRTHPPNDHIEEFAAFLTNICQAHACFHSIFKHFRQVQAGE